MCVAAARCEPSKQRRKKRTLPPAKENLLESFSALKEKLSRPVVDTKTLSKKKSYLPPKSFLCGPQLSSGKEKFPTGHWRGWCMLSFSQGKGVMELTTTLSSDGSLATWSFQRAPASSWHPASWHAGCRLDGPCMRAPGDALYHHGTEERRRRLGGRSGGQIGF